MFTSVLVGRLYLHTNPPDHPISSEIKAKHPTGNASSDTDRTVTLANLISGALCVPFAVLKIGFSVA